MTGLARLFDGLHCFVCHVLDTLWLDPARAMAECRECGQYAHVTTDDGRNA